MGPENNIRKYRSAIILALIFIVGTVAVVNFTKEIKHKEREKLAFRLDAVHEDAKSKVVHSIDHFATLISGIRSYVELSDQMPDSNELQLYVNLLLEDLQYQDSIIVSYLDVNHTFIYTFTRNVQDPANLAGINVADIRSDEQIAALNAIMLDHDLHLFEPLNLIEGWPGIPLNFGVFREGRSLGYIASIINFRTLIEPVYNNPEVIEDFVFKFSIVGGPQFDRETVYDGSKVFNSSKDPENYDLFKIPEEDYISSDIERYGLVFRLGTAYKQRKGSAYQTSYLIYAWYLSLCFLVLIIARQLNVARKANLDLERANAIAEKSLEVRDRFLVNMSHEIRTPLNAIIGFTDLLRSTRLDNEQQQFTETITVASKNLLVLINDVLNVSKIESGQLELEEKPFSIKQVVNDVFNVNSQIADEKKLKLISTMDNDLPEFVIGDSARLFQILLNLVGNSLKFTSEGSVKIEVIADEIEDREVSIHFIVTDTGIGIAEDKQKKIFERFTQAESSTTREYGGSGIGLSIVKMLVELHNGHLDLKSELGVGTEFNFYIKYRISEEEESNIVPETTHQMLTSELAGLQMLIVEDNEHNQILARTYLTRNNIEVDLAENGLKAVEILKEKVYDCILMDLQMPKMDGFQATEKIRQELMLNTPIIACTAHFLEAEKTRSLDVGMNNYLTKPYSEHELLDVIKFTLNGTNPSKSQPVETEPTDHNVRTILESMEKEIGREFLNELLDIFNQRIPQDIIDLKEASANRQMDLLGQKAHLLAGSLGSMKFIKGYHLAIDIDLKSKDGTFEEVEESINQLISYLEDALRETSVY